MPNGGSDCCGTCPFNLANGGKAGYREGLLAGPQRCRIRGEDIEDPFYTYCVNHPHKNPRLLETPIGPILTGDSFGHRTLWRPLLDTEEARLAHLTLLGQIPERPTSTYPAGPSLEVMVIVQLAE